MTDNDLQIWIKKCEGLDLHGYVDTRGHLTIGWGRCLENGISLDEAELMFNNDYDLAKQQLNKQDWFNIQPDGIKSALINMNFNLGIEKLLEFKGMIYALKDKNYELAAQEALNSEWAKQVHHRANDVAEMIKEGK